MMSGMTPVFRVAKTADFDRLYRRFAPNVYRYAYAVLGNHADAEDVTQQTFMNAYRAIAGGTKPRKPENWVMRIAHNEVRRHLGRRHGQAFEVELDERLAHPVEEPVGPTVADVLRALQHLPPVQRAALVMREFEGRPYAEIAEAMDMTQSALEAQIFRARRALTEHLEGALTCTEAEDAVLQRLDGRLPRRVARRLKAHLHECPVCVRFADAQKRQRSLLRGLSVMPIPASLFLFRGEQASAAAGAGTVAGGSLAVGGGGGAAAGAGATGIAAAAVAKIAGITAAAAVAGGVGYGVATQHEPVTTQPSPAARPAPHQVGEGVAIADVVRPRAAGPRRGQARLVSTRSHRTKRAHPARPLTAKVERAHTASKGAVRRGLLRRTGIKIGRARLTRPATARAVAAKSRARHQHAKTAAPPRSLAPKPPRRSPHKKSELKRAQPVTPVSPGHGSRPSK